MSTVLIIDDSPEFADVLATRLTLEGLHVEAARDGATGLEMARSLHPQVIILDLTMPHVSGHQVWTRLRNDPAIAQIPVIIYTSRPQFTDHFWRARIPHEDYYVKGSDLAKLIHRVHTITARPA